MALERTDLRPKRGKGGKYLKGSSGNVLGKPPTGFQSFKDRCVYWWETKTVEEIEKLVNNKKLWKKMISLDAAVARRIHAAQQDTGIQDMRLLLEYILGKPAQAITGAEGQPLIPQLDISEMARKTAFLLSMAAMPVLDIVASPQIEGDAVKVIDSDCS